MTEVTDSLDAWKLKYEHITQTKKQRTQLHRRIGVGWIWFCDSLFDLKRKVFRLARRTGGFKISK